jgi:hypothetical protein
MNKSQRRMRVAVILVICCMAIASLLGGGLLLGRLRVTVENKATFVTIEEAIAFVEDGASLDEIKDAVKRSGKRVDDIAWRRLSLLALAVEKKRLDVATWVLSQGANVNGLHPYWAPLADAVRNHDKAMVMLLIDAGADPDYPMRDDLTPRKCAKELDDEELLGLLPPEKGK